MYLLLTQDPSQDPMRNYYNGNAGILGPKPVSFDVVASADGHLGPDPAGALTVTNVVFPAYIFSSRR